MDKYFVTNITVHSAQRSKTEMKMAFKNSGCLVFYSINILTFVNSKSSTHKSGSISNKFKNANLKSAEMPFLCTHCPVVIFSFSKNVFLVVVNEKIINR